MGDPRNLILLCTTQGIALQQDGAGTKKIYHHGLEEEDDTGGGGERRIGRYWLEAERSTHGVGGAQVETKEEKEDAIRRGKATSSVIGIKAMGTRFNVLMTVQIPLKQKETRVDHPVLFGMCAPPMAMSCNYMDGGPAPMAMSCSFGGVAPGGMMLKSGSGRGSGGGRRIGSANAARVSLGSRVDAWNGLTVRDPERHPTEHVTATIVIYNTIAGGVPSEADVMAAIDDMEDLYAACRECGNLADREFDFMKSELTVKDVMDIKKKMIVQPNENRGVVNFDQFPV